MPKSHPKPKSFPVNKDKKTPKKKKNWEKKAAQGQHPTLKHYSQEIRQRTVEQCNEPKSRNTI